MGGRKERKQKERDENTMDGEGSDKRKGTVEAERGYN